jgi:PAS domain S-box-containing protein
MPGSSGLKRLLSWLVPGGPTIHYGNNLQTDSVIKASDAAGYIPAIVAAAGIAFLAFTADSLNTDAFQRNIRTQVADRLSLIRARLEGNITTDAQLARGLAAVFATEPEMSQEKYARLAAEMIRDKPEVRNLAAAPDLVVRYVYPVAGNEPVVGLDLSTDPLQSAAALQARDAGQLVFAGPINLVQGGKGFAGRLPVYVPDGRGGERFWGLVSTIIDANSLFAASGLLEHDLPLDIAIRSRTPAGAIGPVFQGRPEVFEASPVVLDVVLPYGSWQIAAVPVGGWISTPPNAQYIRTAFWLAGILVVLPLIAVGALIGQRRRAEAKLMQTLAELQEKTRLAEASEEKFAAAFEYSPLVATISRLDTGAILDVNEAFLRVTGLTREETIGLNSGELNLLTGPQRDDFRQQIFETGRVAGMEVQTNMPSGFAVDALIYSQTFVLNEVTYLLTMVHNITDRKNAEREVMAARERADAAQERLRNAMEIGTDGFALFDADDRLVTANSRYIAFFRAIGRKVTYGETTYEEIIRAAAENGLYKAALGRVEDYVRERVASFRTGRGSFEHELANGAWLRVTERRTSDGGTVCFGVNITEMKRREVELVQARAMADAANQAKSTFLSSMSHELRTPMNAILGFAQLLERTPGGAAQADKQKQYARHILNAGNYLLELIDQVLELSKIEAGKLSLLFERVDPVDVIAHSAFMVANRAKRAAVLVVNETEGQELPPITADRSRVRQVLLNLLSNAIKYNRRGGKVTIAAEILPEAGERGMLRICVTDTGTGIPELYQNQVFEPFNRLGREADGTEGSGIGLTITRQIVELLGGAIGFKSQENIGTSFWADFPIAGPSPESEIPAAAKRATFAQVSDSSERQILYVEDNSSNLQLMEELLATVPHLNMLSAQTAALALDIAREHQPDLILLDINLPEMNGFEVLKRLQSEPETMHIPVIAVTAAAMPNEVEMGLQAGFKEYITKPIDIVTVLNAIDRHLA